MKLSLIVLLNIKGSCLIIDTFFLKESSVISLILILLINISPSLVSNILVIKLNNVDLPWPDLPTTAIFLLGSNLILKFLRVISSSLYPNVTFLNSIVLSDKSNSISPNFSSSYN